MHQEIAEARSSVDHHDVLLERSGLTLKQGRWADGGGPFWRHLAKRNRGCVR